MAHSSRLFWDQISRALRLCSSIGTLVETFLELEVKSLVPFQLHWHTDWNTSALQGISLGQKQDILHLQSRCFCTTTWYECFAMSFTVRRFRRTTLCSNFVHWIKILLQHKYTGKYYGADDVFVHDIICSKKSCHDVFVHTSSYTMIASNAPTP